MSTTKATFLVDIDGVVNWAPLDDREANRTRFDTGGLVGAGVTVFPTPRCRALLHVLSQTPWIRPLWLSAWRGESHLWNDHAGTRRWPTAAGAVLRETLPRRLYQQHADWKTWVAQGVAKRFLGPVVWIEDGFLREAVDWAATEPRVTLLDVTPEPLRSAEIQGQRREYSTAADDAHATIHCRQEETPDDAVLAVEAWLERLRWPLLGVPAAIMKAPL